MSGTAEAVTALVFDATPAAQGAAQFDAAGQKIISTNREVVNATSRTVDAQGNMERALARLTRQIDPAAAAQAKLEAGQRLLERAFQRGAITADEQARRLALLDARYQASATAAGRLATANDNAAASLTRLNAANDNATASSGRFNGALGQVGFQVQDFATQVSMGQNALMAFGVQFAQLAGFFGAAGAIAGAGVMIGVIAAQLLLGKSNADALNDAIKVQDALWSSATERAEQYRAGLEAQRQTIQDLRVAYAQLTAVALASEERRLQAAQATLQAQREQLANDAQAGLRGLPRAASNIAGMIQARQRVGLPVEGLPPQVTEAVGAILQFRAGDANAESLAQLSQRLTEAASVASSALSPALIEVRDRVDQLVTRARELDGAMGRNEQQLRAVRDAAANTGPALETAEGTARRTAGSFAELAQRAGDARNAMARLGGYQLTGLEGAQQALERANAELRALRQGGLAGGEAFTQEERALQRIATAREEDVKNIMERSRVSREQAEALADDAAAAEARSQVVRSAVEREAEVEARRKQLQEEARDAARGTTAAVLELRDAYGELRRDAQTGLLLVSDADARAVREISQQLRGTSLDPAIRVRAEADAARTAEREAEQRRREADRFTQNWGDRLAQETTRGFFEGSRNGETFFSRIGNSLKNILISAVSAALSRQVFQPLISAALGGGGGGLNLGGLVSGGTAQAGTPAAGGGGLTDSLGSFQSLRTAYNGLTAPGGLGGFFPGGAPVNTGFDGLNGLLNTSLVTPTLNSITPTVGAAGTFLPAGVQGPILPAALPVAETGLTLAGSLGPLAAIGGGAYGVYSGIQRGGVGGFTSAAGGAISAATGIGMLGAAAGLLPALGALGPIGLGIGAVLAIAGALMPGAKPSGMGQLARTNLNTGMETTEGLGGKRFSAGNATAAGSTVDNIVALAKEVGSKLGGATIGGDVAAGVTRGDIYLDINGQKTRAANNEQGSKDIAAAAAKMILNEFGSQGTVQGPYRGILAASGDSLEKLDANLQWYEQVYKAYEEQADAGDKVAKATQAVVARFNPLIDKAHELGLSSDRLVEAREREWQAAKKAVEEAEKARLAEIASLKVSLDARMAATKGVTDLEAIALIAQTERTQTWTAELDALEKRLTALGETTGDVATQVAKLKSVQSAEYWDNLAKTMGELDYSVQTRILRAEGLGGSADWMDFDKGAMQQIQALAITLAQLGVSADIAAQKIAQTQQAIDAERIARVKANDQILKGMDQSLDGRILRAQGKNNEADVADFEATAARELADLPNILKNLGATAATTADIILKTEAAIGAERVALQKRIADEIAEAQKQAAAEAAAAWEQFLNAGRGIRSYIDSLKTQTGPGGVSTATALTEAQKQFGTELALSRGGDMDALSRITSAADRLLNTAQDQYASGADFQAIRSFVISSLESLPATRSYDAMILDELKKLGGGISVSVDLEVIRVITETLSALPATDAAKLVQSQVILRNVEQKIGRNLTTEERDSLIAPANILRSISQTIGRDLTATERSLLVNSATIQRDVQQILGRNLTATERASLVQGGTTLRTIEQVIGRDLTEAERVGLIRSATVQRDVQQIIGRDLTVVERDGLVQAGTVLRTVQQAIGRTLTDAERSGLVQGGSVIRTVEQAIGRSLTDTERAGLVQTGTALRTVEQSIGRNLTEAERAGLIQGGTALRTVEQSIGRNLTEAERAGLVQGGTAIRTVEQALGRNLTAAERDGLVQGGTALRVVEQALGRNLTEAERAGLVQGGTTLRIVEQAIGRNLTDAERGTLIQSAAVMRDVMQRLAATLSPAEQASLIQSGSVVRLIEQRIGRALTTAEVNGLVASGTVQRSIEQFIGRSLTDAERAGLVQAAIVQRNVQQTLGRDLTVTERAALVQSGTALRLVEQALGRNLTDAERDGLIVAADVQRTVEQVLGRDLTEAERAMLVEPGFINRTVKQAIETTETVQISRSMDDKLSAILNAQLVIGREQLASDKAIGTEANNHTRQMMSDLNIFWRTAAGVAGPGLFVRSSERFAGDFGVIRFAKGGVFDSPMTFPMAGGRTGMLGEAGPEAIMPLRRGPDGALGVRAMQAGNGELVAELRALRREVAELRQERAAASERQTRVTAAVGEETLRQGQETNAILRSQADQQRLAGAA